jgi:hypothetical protein
MKAKKQFTILTIIVAFAVLFSIVGHTSEAEAYKGLILPNGEKMAPMELLTLTPGSDPTLNHCRVVEKDRDTSSSKGNGEGCSC